MYSGFAVLCDMAATVAMFYYLSSQQTEYKGQVLVTSISDYEIVLILH